MELDSYMDKCFTADWNHFSFVCSYSLFGSCQVTPVHIGRLQKFSHSITPAKFRTAMLLREQFSMANVISFKKAVVAMIIYT